MSAPPTAAAATRRGSLQLDPFERIWRLLSNVRFALLQILVLMLLTFVGTAISQVPPPMRADPQLVERWVSAIARQYGAATPYLHAIGVFDMYSSVPYRVLLGLLTVSVIVCTLNRAPAIWRNVTGTPFQRRLSYYEKAENTAHARVPDVSPGAAVAAIVGGWRSLGYRVLVDQSGPGQFVYADRYRLARLATFVNHLGLIMILAGGAATGIFGERNDGFVIPVGATRQLGLGTNYSVQAESFVDEYYLHGGAKDYRSELVVYEGDREVKRATVRVNEPLLIGPVKLHQAYFGQAIVMEVRKRGQVIYRDSVPLAFTAIPYGFRSVGFFRLPSEGLSIDLVAAENAADEAVGAGQVALFGYPLGSADPLFGGVLTQRSPHAWGELEFTFVRESQFTGLQAVRDPGAPIFFIASGLMLAGILAVFYFPQRRLWAMVEADQEGGSRVWVAGVCQRNPGFGDEFRQAVSAAERSMSGVDSGKTG